MHPTLPHHPHTLVRRLGAALGVAVVTLFPSAATAAPDPGPTEVVTVEPAHISVSADGGTTVYSAEDESGDVIVMLADTSADASDDDPTPLTSIGDGMRRGDTVLPVVSGDGCVVVAISQVAFDLLRDNDQHRRWDVYRLVLPACSDDESGWELVSTDSSEIAIDSVSSVVRPSVSATGSTVAYTAVDASGRTSVHVVDLTQPITSQRTRTLPEPTAAPSMPYLYRGADQPVLSGDGSWMAFRADFDPTGDEPEWSSGPVRGGDAAAQVYAWDLDQPDRFELVSQRGGEPAQNGARQPAISADGSTVAFIANDPLLDPTVGWVCDPRCPEQVMVSHRSGEWSPPLVASASPLAAPVEDGPDGGATTGNRRSWHPRLSADGTRVAFFTHATNLTASGALPSPLPRAGDLLIADTGIGSDPDDARSTTPPVPLDPSTPRASNHTGFATSASMATAVFDVETVSDGRIVGDARGRTIVAVSTDADLTMADLNFGTVLDDLESDELFTSVRNGGPVGFIPQSVEIDSDRFDVTGGSCTTDTVVPPGGTCTVFATFTPADGESAVAVLTVTGAEGQRVTATVAGRSGAPGLRIEPSGVDFGRSDVGSGGDDETVTIVNYGFDPITPSTIAVTGRDSGDVTIEADACTGVTIEPEGSCDVSVRFAPGAAGARWATLLVESNDGPATAATLVGVGTRSATLSIDDADDDADDDALTVDGSGFAPNSPIVVSVVGQHTVYDATTDDNGDVRLTEVAAGIGPQVTVVAVDADGTMALSRATVSVEPSTPTFLPGYGNG